MSKFAKDRIMAHHNTLGKGGEEAAIAYLKAHGYLIRHKNWRKGRFELDIIAANNDELIVIEVKTRTNTHYSLPHEAVTPQKIKRTVVAADAYIKTFQIDAPVRFDIITVVGEENDFDIEHIQNAFYPPVW